MTRCEICVGRELCERIIKAGAKGISCKEMREMLEKILAEDEE